MAKNRFILNFLKLYNLLWKLALPLLKKNSRLSPQFDKRTSSEHFSEADIWIQAASAGEALLAVRIIKCLEPAKKIRILVTSTTIQGIEILKSELTNDQADLNTSASVLWDHNITIETGLFPFDCPAVMKNAVKRINPTLMVLLETEIWPAHLFYLRENGTKIFIINARLSEKSCRNYMRTKFIWKHIYPDQIFAVSPSDKSKYEKVFSRSVISTMPNIKFDIFESSLTKNAEHKNHLENLLAKKLPFTILASIRTQEEKQTLEMIKHLLKEFPDQIVAVFPRHMHRIKHWEKKLNRSRLRFSLRTDLQKPFKGPGIILWDKFGELNQAYRLAHSVFVGGSLKPLGGQNFLEPATAGAFTVTGPYYDDFAWAGEDIFIQNIVSRKNSWQDAAKAIVSELKAPKIKKNRAAAAEKYLKSSQGGSLKASSVIMGMLEI